MATAQDAAEVERLKPPVGTVQFDAAFDAAGTLHLLYTAVGTEGGPIARRQATLLYAQRQGDGWSEPIRVNQTDNHVRPIGSQPKLAIGRDGRIHAAWIVPTMPKWAFGIYYTRMTDAGDAFEPERNLALEDARGYEAGPIVLADADGAVYLFWHEGPFREEETRRVMMRRSSDDGREFAAAVSIAPAGSGACACCKLAAALGPDGTLWVSFRTAEDNVRRDMTLLASGDEGASFDGVGYAEWELESCPTSASSIAPRSSQATWIAWDNKGRSYLAQTDALDRAKELPRVTGKGLQKHPVLAQNDAGQLLVAWTEGKGRRRTLHWQLRGADGSALGEPQSAEKTRPTFRTAVPLARPDGAFAMLY
ncbi:MAG: exo-alpha-sialidase [Planctomycetota bacterium]